MKSCALTDRQGTELYPRENEYSEVSGTRTFSALTHCEQVSRQKQRELKCVHRYIQHKLLLQRLHRRASRSPRALRGLLPLPPLFPIMHFARTQRGRLRAQEEPPSGPLAHLPAEQAPDKAWSPVEEVRKRQQGQLISRGKRAQGSRQTCGDDPVSLGEWLACTYPGFIQARIAHSVFD